MRYSFVLVTVGFVSAANAQPVEPVPQAAQTPTAPSQDTSVEARAGLGFGRYSEHMIGFDFDSDIQPFALAGVEAVLASGGRGAAVLQVNAGMGFDVGMHATQLGSVIQRNRFRQEIYDGSVRYRHLRSPRFFLEVGYRFTLQQLHFSDIRDAMGNPGPIPGATETVYVHAIEGGLGWQRVNPDQSRRQLLFTVGLNRGNADNTVITDENFSAVGASLGAAASHRFASGLELEAQLAWRQQGGSEMEQVTAMGMQTTGVWPQNTTWNLLALVGYGF